jgi:gliding motility-associated-like protein
VISNQTCSNRYIITRTWTATDACGNSSSSIQLITVNDTIKPTFTSQLPADIIVDCNSIPQAATLSSTDNCGQATVTLSESTTVGGCSGAGGIIRTWTATDACGNTSIHIQNITVQDTTKPVITGTPQAITVSCASDVPAASIGNISATDNCNGTVTKTVADVITNQTCNNRYTITRTWTATDACGNSSTSTQLITVNDTINPTFTSQLPTDIIVDCNSIPQAATVTATDNCGQATVTLSESTTIGGCSGAGGIIRTWTATDACGNTSTHIQNITVQDTTKPVITGTPQAITVSCASDVPAASIANISATDNCNGTVTKTVADVISNQTCSNRYTITRTWTATDACGNSSSTSQLITVNDTIKPTFTSQLPADVIVDCNSIPQAATLSATDNCGQATVTLSESTTVGGCSGAGGIIRTWTATDACGNTRIHIQNITVQDTTKPVITGTPQAITVNCASEVPAASIANISATDNCNGTVTKTVTDVITNQTCSNHYTITRTWTATDACGNSSTSKQLITVNDTIKPTFTSQLPADIIVDCNSIPQAATISATDNCGQATVTLSESTTVGGCSGAGGIIRTWTATDACGNTSIHIQNITVQDTTKPVITGTPQPITVSCASDVPAASITNVSTTDNCNGTVTKTVADVITNQTCSNRYTITRTWTATDACGNSSTSTQLITVNDTIKPTFTSQLPADIIVDCNSIPQAATISATDNCGQATVTLSESTTVGGCSGAGGIIRTWTATDACGNTSIHIQNITVQDTTKPVITGTPQAITVSCASDVPAASIGNISATDNCNGTVTKTVADVISNQTCSNSYTITRTWTATDACGNSSTSKQLITVNDTIPPLIEETPRNIILSCETEVPEASISSVIVTDNCSANVSISVIDETENQTCSNDFTIIRTWTAIDECGNSSTSKQIIKVRDTIQPIILSVPVDITISCTEEIPTASINAITATDNCRGNLSIDVSDIFGNQTCEHKFTITRTWIVSDVCGNSAIASQIITVNDSINPLIADVPQDITVSCASDVPVANSSNITVTDNCLGTITQTVVDVISNEICANKYTITRIWTATDTCGNSSIAEQIITVNDSINPAFVEALPQDMIVCKDVPNAPILTATDNCGAATVRFTETIDSVSTSNIRIYTRIWTAIDVCQNITTHRQIITVLPVVQTLISREICEGRYVELGNNSYGLSGTYHAMFESAQGCDSIVILTLNVNPVKQTNIDAVICSGEEILVGDFVFTESVTNELIYLETSKGCDSIVVLNLIVLNSDTTTTNRTICSGDRVEIGGVTFTSSGTYYIPFQNNQCNGVVQLNLTVLQPTASNINLEICEDEVVTVAGQVYSESGIYSITTQNALGCDSIITLNLNVKQQTNSILDKTICYGESFTIGNQTFNTSGSYVVLFSNTAGCDSTVLLNLNVIGQNDTLRISRTICEGESTIVEDQEFNEDGIYYVAFENGSCSAILELTLTVNATSTTVLNEVICVGEAVVIGNQTFTNEGSYSVILQNSTGCDSIVTLNLQVSDGGNKTILDTTICYGEIYKYGDQSFSTTGTFQLIYPVDNCRDTVLVNLLVNPISIAAIDTAIFDCQGGLLIGGQLFNEAGIYQIPLTNSLGCDSIITLNLRIRLCDTIPLGQEITIYDTLPVQTTISICDLSLPPGNNVVVEACSGTTSGTTTIGTWTINNQTNCLEYTAGQILGNDTLCMNACDTVTRQCDITTVIITITGLPPVANDDCVEETEKNTEINIDVIANDTDPDLDELFIESIISPPKHGTATIQQNDQTISYMPNKNFCGRDTFYYEVCDGNDGCDTAMVCIEIKCECVLPQVITPNNDGFNDNLFFPCIGSVEGARLLVWHRWGLIVYEDNNYKNDWQGTLKGELLPAGTYWYSIEYKDRETQQDVKEVNYFMIIN